MMAAERKAAAGEEEFSKVINVENRAFKIR